MNSTHEPDTERLRRIADNEALFRSVNERVEEINDTFAPLTHSFDIVCECGNIQCIDRIPVEPRAYERVRADSALFFVVPGHELPEAEDVVDRASSYAIVRKHPGIPQAIAEEQDPRAASE
jgi:hypothetical protein